MNITLFFDGAGANKYNTQKYLEGGKYFDSDPDNLYNYPFREEHKAFYDALHQDLINDEEEKPLTTTFTNISKLYNLLSDNKDSKKIYVTGVGTLTGVNDNSLVCRYGNITGRGNAGAIAKYLEALESFIEVIMNTSEDVITVNTIGFSRGAAVSRHFINRLYKLKNRLVKEDYTLEEDLSRLITNKTIIIQDVVLIDTVVQVYSVSDLSYIFNNQTVQKDFVGNLDVTLLPESYKKCIQFEARKEFRFNFPLHDIPDAQNSTRIVLEGVHADVGGGYSIDQPKAIYTKPVVYPNPSGGLNIYLVKDEVAYTLEKRNIGSITGKRNKNINRYFMHGGIVCSYREEKHSTPVILQNTNLYVIGKYLTKMGWNISCLISKLENISEIQKKISDNFREDMISYINGDYTALTKYPSICHSSSDWTPIVDIENLIQELKVGNYFFETLADTDFIYQNRPAKNNKRVIYKN